ncbi:hypothetical protein, partial [Xanthomonas citri]
TVKPVDEAKAITACDGERAPVTGEIPKENAINGEKSEAPNATLRNDATFRPVRHRCSDLP